VTALVGSLSAMLGVVALVNILIEFLGTNLFIVVHDVMMVIAPLGLNRGGQHATSLLMLVVIAAFLAVMLSFALANHRSAERRSTPLWQQFGFLAGSLTAALALLAGAASVIYRL
jgi:hypothetical protein